MSTREQITATLAAHWEIEGTHAEGFKCTCGYGLGDGTGDLDARHRDHFAEALIASGLIPEAAHPVTEWRINYGDDGPTPPRPESWCRTHYSERHGDVVETRTRTKYPDRITDWEEVQ